MYRLLTIDASRLTLSNREIRETILSLGNNEGALIFEFTPRAGITNAVVGDPDAVAFANDARFLGGRIGFELQGAENPPVLGGETFSPNLGTSLASQAAHVLNQNVLGIKDSNYANVLWVSPNTKLRVKFTLPTSATVPAGYQLLGAEIRGVRMPAQDFNQLVQEIRL